jgi:hypothetical protein
MSAVGSEISKTLSPLGKSNDRYSKGSAGDLFGTARSVGLLFEPDFFAHDVLLVYVYF